MAEKSLHGGPKRPFCENVKVNPVLCWRLKDIKGGGGGCLPWRAANREWNQPKREKYAADTKLEGWGTSKPSDIRPFATSDVE